jgi:hypothetical protein
MVITDGNPVVLVLRYIRYLYDSEVECNQYLVMENNAPSILSFVRPDDGEEVVPFQELAGRCIAAYLFIL